MAIHSGRQRNEITKKDTTPGNTGGCGNESAGDRTQDPQIKSLEDHVSNSLKNQAIPPDSDSCCTPSCTNTVVHLSDLARLVEKWPTLPAHIKAAVMALVGSAPAPNPNDPKLSDDQLPPGYEARTGNGGG